MDSIIFNSNREKQNGISRSKIERHKSLIDFFGVYTLYKFDGRTGRMVFEKGTCSLNTYQFSSQLILLFNILDEQDIAIKKRIEYNSENRTWTLGNYNPNTNPKIFWYYHQNDR